MAPILKYNVGFLMLAVIFLEASEGLLLFPNGLSMLADVFFRLLDTCCYFLMHFGCFLLFPGGCWMLAVISWRLLDDPCM